MRQVLCLLICLVALTCSAQKYNWKRAIAPASLSFVSGASWGLHEVTANKWPEVKAKWPRINEKFWNPAVSWRNKWVDGDPTNGRTRFAGVVIPAHVTDAKHISASLAQGGLLASGVLIGIGEKRPWWHYGIDLIINFGAYTLGNQITYSKWGILR